METKYKCLKCNKENKISDINGSCKYCDNNNPDNFGIVFDKEFAGMSGFHELSLSRSLLSMRLADKSTLTIDPKSSIDTTFKH